MKRLWSVAVLIAALLLVPTNADATGPESNSYFNNSPVSLGMRWGCISTGKQWDQLLPAHSTLYRPAIYASNCPGTVDANRPWAGFYVGRGFAVDTYEIDYVYDNTGAKVIGGIHEYWVNGNCAPPGYYMASGFYAAWFDVKFSLLSTNTC